MGIPALGWFRYDRLPVVGSFLCYIPGCRFGLTVDYWWRVQLYYYTVSHYVIGEGVPC